MKKNDPRYEMYRLARKTLATEITFSDEERLEKLQAEKAALVATRDKQIEAARVGAHSLGAAERATLRIEELYAEELKRITDEIEELTPTTTTP